MLIQKLRLQHGWSQAQLAELSGLSIRTIQRLERGETASVESLKALGAVFGISFSDLREPDMSTQTVETPKSILAADEALALAHVRDVKRFYVHLIQFAIVVAILGGVNYFLTPRAIWAPFVFLGWGSGVLFHGLRVFNAIPFLNADWERQQVEKYLGRKL